MAMLKPFMMIPVSEQPVGNKNNNNQAVGGSATSSSSYNSIISRGSKTLTERQLSTFIRRFQQIDAGAEATAVDVLAQEFAMVIGRSSRTLPGPLPQPAKQDSNNLHVDDISDNDDMSEDECGKLPPTAKSSFKNPPNHQRVTSISDVQTSGDFGVDLVPANTGKQNGNGDGTIEI